MRRSMAGEGLLALDAASRVMHLVRGKSVRQKAQPTGEHLGELASRAISSTVQDVALDGHCESVGEGVARKVCCSVGDQASAWSCLPSMVTIGAQKSGTTALYAYLGQHEHFVAGADGKEVQFFSSLARWNAGPHRYMEAFPVMERDDAERAVVADMSPAYMTDFGTLQSMAELLPDARIVVMLREPVERAWSEISMLRRQQRTQIEKDQFLLKHASELRACAEQMADGVAGLIGKVKEDEARKYECASPASADEDLARVFQRTWRALGRKVVKLGMEAVFVRGARVSDLMSQIRLTTDDESCTMSL